MARRQGLLGFTAEVLVENQPMLHLFEKMASTSSVDRGGVVELRMQFRERHDAVRTGTSDISSERARSR